jgi:hypothetical protein
MFVLADERKGLVSRERMIKTEYADWYRDAIQERDALELQPTVRRHLDVIDQNIDNIKRVIRETEQARDEMFENVPFD